MFIPIFVFCPFYLPLPWLLCFFLYGSFLKIAENFKKFWVLQTEFLVSEPDDTKMER